MKMSECCCKNNCVKVGTIIYSHIVQPGYMTADGRLLSRCAYSDLFRFAFENQLMLREEDWVNGMQGMYAEGDGKSTFRMPDLRGEFLRGLDNERGIDANRTLGSQQEDAIRNIIGNVVIRQVSDGKSYTDPIPGGCFVTGEYEAGVYEMNGKSGIKAPYAQGFDASRVVPTAEENRPKNIALIAQIKY